MARPIKKYQKGGEVSARKKRRRARKTEAAPAPMTPKEAKPIGNRKSLSERNAEAEKNQAALDKRAKEAKRKLFLSEAKRKTREIAKDMQEAGIYTMKEYNKLVKDRKEKHEAEKARRSGKSGMKK